MQENLSISEEKAIENCIRAMNYYSLYGDARQYNFARRQFAWFCNRYRARQKSDEENLKINNSVGENAG